MAKVKKKLKKQSLFNSKTKANIRIYVLLITTSFKIDKKKQIHVNASALINIIKKHPYAL